MMQGEGLPTYAEQAVVAEGFIQLNNKMDRLLDGQNAQNRDIAEMKVHHKYSVDRFDQQCERIKGLELKCEMLESADQQRKGHIQMIAWIGGAIGTITAVAVVIIAVWKG